MAVRSLRARCATRRRAVGCCAPAALRALGRRDRRRRAAGLPDRPGPRPHRRWARSSPRRCSARRSSPCLLGLRGGRLDRVRLLQVVALLMIATGLAFGLVASFAVLAGGGRRRHDQPVRWRRQRLPPDRAVAAARHRARRARAPTCSRATPSSRRWPGPSARWPPGCPDGLTERTDVDRARSRSKRCSSSTRLAGVVIFFVYRRLRPRPPVDLAEGARHGLAPVACDRPPPGRAVQRGLLRRRLRRPGDPRAVAVAPLRPVDRDSRARCSSGAACSRPARRCSRPRLAGRIGLIRTMVYTHLPANAAGDRRRAHADRRAGGGVPAGPRAAVADGRARPARRYVMAVVDPEERAAAASVTNVPRSLASAAAAARWPAGCSPRPSFGWPLIIGGDAQDRLRPGPPAPVPRRPPARGDRAASPA